VQPDDGQPAYGQPRYAEPGYAQPGFAQPNPDVPSSVPPGYPAPDPTQVYGQPGYGQPGYGQPAYGQPGYGQPGYGFPVDPSAPKKKSRVLPIVLISVAVVLVLCVGGSVAIYLAARNTQDKLTGQVTNPTATAPTTGAPAQPTDQATTTAPPAAAKVGVTEPKTLGGRAKRTDAQFKPLVDELQSGMKDIPDVTSTVGALYGVPAKHNLVIVTAGAAPIDDPAAEIDQLFSGVGVGGLAVSGISAVSTGTLGGTAKCGKADESGTTLELCGWADEGSIGLVIFIDASPAKAKAEFPKLREQIEKKSS
jgi:hypothetical protein